MIEIEIKDLASPQIAKLAGALKSPRPLLAAAGKRVEVDLRAHFLRRNAQGNRQGWPRTNFWNRIRKSTALDHVNDQEAVVSVSDPAINQKLHGGTITPKRGKYLAIPARAEAYGHSPRDFDDLEFIPTARGGMLVQRVQSLLRRGKKGFRSGGKPGGGTFFFLVKSVTQAADPEALPPREDLDAAVHAEVRAWISRRLSRSS